MLVSGADEFVLMAGNSSGCFPSSRRLPARNFIVRLGFHAINFRNKPFARSIAASVSRRHERLHLQRLGEAGDFIGVVDSQDFRP